MPQIKIMEVKRNEKRTATKNAKKKCDKKFKKQNDTNVDKKPDKLTKNWDKKGLQRFNKTSDQKEGVDTKICEKIVKKCKKTKKDVKNVIVTKQEWKKHKKCN